MSRRDAVRALKALLEARASATSALQALCARPIHVLRLPDTSAPDARILLALGVASTQDVVTRHVRLMCDATALSDAWNWYVPARLTSAMNTMLLGTDTPFGHIVQESWFRRRALTSHSPDTPSGPVLCNQAVLHRISDDAPIAFVREEYTVAALEGWMNAPPSSD